jgi:hypothetical protein
MVGDQNEVNADLSTGIGTVSDAGIDILGLRNHVDLNQSSSDAQTVSNNADISVIGDDNLVNVQQVTSVFQHRAPVNNAEIAINGSANQVEVIQSSPRNNDAFIHTIGNGNSVSVTQ